jgi:hypothetical protein
MSHAHLSTSRGGPLRGFEPVRAVRVTVARSRHRTGATRPSTYGSNGAELAMSVGSFATADDARRTATEVHAQAAT